MGCALIELIAPVETDLPAPLLIRCAPGVFDRLTRARRVRLELRVAAYAVCATDGHLLLVRYAEHGAPHWTLPGGGIEHGEDPYHAVVREVAEETGYVFEVERLLGIHSARHAYPRGRLAVADHHAVRVVYTGRVTGGTLRHEVGGSTDLAAWVPMDRLDELASARADLVDMGLELARACPPTGHPGR
jgi:8-oxo-dGTP diphosphatase